MIKKSQIGVIVPLVKVPSYYEFFYIESLNKLDGYRSDIIISDLPPDDPLSKAPLIRIEMDEITVFTATGMFLNHTGLRMFYCDTDGYLQEFLPVSRTTITPTDYGAIQIIAGDKPLMLLEDGSLLITYQPNTDRLKVITETTRGNDIEFYVEADIATDIHTLNYVGSRGTFEGTTVSGNKKAGGDITFNGFIPISITNEHDLSTGQQASGLSATINNEMVAILNFSNPNELEFSAYNNKSGDGELIYRTQRDSRLIPSNDYTTICSYRDPIITTKGVLRSIFVSPEIRDLLPTDTEGVYTSVWTAGYRVATFTVEDQQSDLLTDVDTSSNILIEGDIYNIQSIEEVDSRTSLITLIYRQSGA